MAPGPDDEDNLDEHARLSAIAAAMRAMFGDEAGAVTQRQIDLAGLERPEIARRWRAIATLLSRGKS